SGRSPRKRSPADGSSTAAAARFVARWKPWPAITPASLMLTSRVPVFPDDGKRAEIAGSVLIGWMPPASLQTYPWFVPDSRPTTPPMAVMQWEHPERTGASRYSGDAHPHPAPLPWRRTAAARTATTPASATGTRPTVRFSLVSPRISPPVAVGWLRPAIAWPR